MQSRHPIPAQPEQSQEVITDDVDPFVHLYRREGESVLRFFHRRTFCPETAADLTAETFAIAFSARGNYRDVGRSETAWLFGIARNQLRRFHRRSVVSERARRRLGVLTVRLEEDEFDEIDRLVDQDWRVRLVSLAMEVLTESELEAVRLRVHQDQPYATVARELGCSEGAARVRVSRALTKLSNKLEESCPNTRSHF